MQKRLIALLLMLMCSACAHQQYGNYAKISDIDNVRMAKDSVHELALLYPPASTHFEIQQPTADVYGAGLVQGLRKDGYFVQESQSFGDALRSALGGSDATPAPSTKEKKQDEADISKLPPKARHSGAAAVASNKAIPAPAAAESQSKSLSYIVDQLGEGMYRVTLNVDSDVLSKVYANYKNHLVSAGSWTRKE